MMCYDVILTSFADILALGYNRSIFPTERKNGYAELDK